MSRLYIDSSGNMGVGTTTRADGSAFTSKLNVNGDVAIEPGSGLAIKSAGAPVLVPRDGIVIGNPSANADTRIEYSSATTFDIDVRRSTGATLRLTNSTAGDLILSLPDGSISASGSGAFTTGVITPQIGSAFDSDLFVFTTGSATLNGSLDATGYIKTTGDLSVGTDGSPTNVILYANATTTGYMSVGTVPSSGSTFESGYLNVANQGNFGGAVLIGSALDNDDDLLGFDQSAEFLRWDNDHGEFDLTDDLSIEGNLAVGISGAGLDYTLTFDGETNNGLLTWMEDEDYLKFSDNNLMDSTKATYYRDTALNIASLDDGHLDLTADVAIDLNSNVLITGNATTTGTHHFDDVNDAIFTNTPDTACSTQCGDNACLAAFMAGPMGAIPVATDDATADYCYCSH